MKCKKPDCQNERLEGKNHCVFHEPNKNREEAARFYIELEQEINRKSIKKESPKENENGDKESEGRTVKERINWDDYYFPEISQYKTFNMRDYVIKKPWSLKNATFEIDVDLRGVIFKSQLDLREANFKKGARFDGAQFEGELKASDVDFVPKQKEKLKRKMLVGDVFFRKATFEGKADFRSSSWRHSCFDQAKFIEGADFRNVTAKEFNCRKASFKLKADFSGSKTNLGKTQFNDTTFLDGATFRSTTFTKISNFSGVEFGVEGFKNRKVDFGDVVFRGRVRFQGVTFFNEVTFSRAIFQNGADFTNTKFHRKAVFQNSKFETEENKFQSVKFLKEALFTKAVFHNSTIFKNSVFTDNTKFDSSIFYSRVDLTSSTFQEGVDFSGSWFIGESIFSGVIFDRLANFTNSVFLDRLDFSNTDFRLGIKIVDDTNDESTLGTGFEKRFQVTGEAEAGSCTFNEVLNRSIINFESENIKRKKLRVTRTRGAEEQQLNVVLEEGESITTRWEKLLLFLQDIWEEITSEKQNKIDGWIRGVSQKINQNKEVRGDNKKLMANFGKQIGVNKTKDYLKEVIENELKYKQLDTQKGCSVFIKESIIAPRFPFATTKETAFRKQKVSFEREGRKEDADQMFVNEMRARRRKEMDKLLNRSRLITSFQKPKEQLGPLLKKLSAFREWNLKGISKVIFEELRTILYLIKWYLEKPIVDWSCSYGTSWGKILAWSGSLTLVVFPALYFLCGIGLLPGTFQITTSNPETLITEFYLSLYYSIVTFTTLGMGTLNPTGFLPRILSAIEATIGVVLVALIVAVFARKWMR